VFVQPPDRLFQAIRQLLHVLVEVFNLVLANQPDTSIWAWQ
jgi:hypothetical protein